jgi:dihydrofolate reductase
MSQVVLFMSMSLDGFIAGPDDTPEEGLGRGGQRLHDWVWDREADELRPSSEASRLVIDEMLSTGAVITGRRTGDFVDYWGGDHHGEVPIFVPTHDAPAENRHARVHFVTDGIESCVAQAKAAAAGRDVMMHGAYTAQSALRAGVLDVLEIQLVPVLLGEGRRLLEGLPAGETELDLVRTLETPDVLHLRYEVRR